MFFERHESGERAIIVDLQFSAPKFQTRKSNQQDRQQEFKELVASAGATCCYLLVGSRAKPDPKLFMGSGKLEELKNLINSEESDIVIFNHDLSPSQERNLEKELQCRVLGRTGLILDIFAQRARTHEGKLQVELAQLEHSSTRLVRGWTHLERQKGGIGLRGPGETQLETDRRLLRVRIKSLNARLDKVKSQRKQGRRSREKAEISTVSVVGYTNAGKSTLFNRLTQSDVFAEDQLFATLDPTMRRIDVHGFGELVLADTVGFIRDLPHSLIDAFRATLEEASNAHLLLHVIDATNPDWQENVAAVEDVLEEIGAKDIPCLKVFNKIDLLEHQPFTIKTNACGVPLAVWCSAQTGEGCEQLLASISDVLLTDAIEGTYNIPASWGGFRASLHQHNAVQSEQYDENGNMQLAIRIKSSIWYKLLSHEGLTEKQLEKVKTA